MYSLRGSVLALQGLFTFYNHSNMARLTCDHVASLFVKAGMLHKTPAKGIHVSDKSEDPMAAEIWFCEHGIKALAGLGQPGVSVIPHYVAFPTLLSFSKHMALMDSSILGTQRWIKMPADDGSPHWMFNPIQMPKVGSGAQHWIGNRTGVKFALVSNTSLNVREKEHRRHAVCLVIDFRTLPGKLIQLDPLSPNQVKRSLTQSDKRNGRKVYSSVEMISKSLHIPEIFHHCFGIQSDKLKQQECMLSAMTLIEEGIRDTKQTGRVWEAINSFS